MVDGKRMTTAPRNNGLLGTSGGLPHNLATLHSPSGAVSPAAGGLQSPRFTPLLTASILLLLKQVWIRSTGASGLSNSRVAASTMFHLVPCLRPVQIRTPCPSLGVANEAGESWGLQGRYLFWSHINCCRSWSIVAPDPSVSVRQSPRRRDIPGRRPRVSDGFISPL